MWVWSPLWSYCEPAGRHVIGQTPAPNAVILNAVESQSNLWPFTKLSRSRSTLSFASPLFLYWQLPTWVLTIVLWCGLRVLVPCLCIGFY